MSCAVNLLPESCHNARRRARRRNAWSVAVVSAGLLVVGTWVAFRATDRTLLWLNRQLASAQSKQCELDRQLTLATRLRNDLTRRARTLAALRQEHLLPEQLLTLTRQAPAGVVFTEITAHPATGARTAARPGSRAFRAVGSRWSPPRSTVSHDQSAANGPLIVQMSGYAVDHDQLTRLIGVLQRVPQWEQVELLGAAREPYRTGTALAFQLECRPAEVSR